MKFIRYAEKSGNQTKQGILSDQVVQEISGDPFTQWTYTGNTCPADQVRLLPPLAPRHIIGIGRNYVEAGQAIPPLPKLPVFFFKPASSVIGPEDQIEVPEGSDAVKFESELAVVIGKAARNIGESEVMPHIFGYTVVNDVTAPDYFHPDGHWTLGKAFDTFTPLGPAIETEPDLSRIRVQSLLNGSLKQDSGLDLMIVTIPHMISCLSRFMTLMPGDVILTGAPAGAEWIRRGDTIECRIDGIGTLRNSVG